MIIVKYETEEEAQQIINDNTSLGLVLVEVSNITEGNFLGFSEEALPIVPDPIQDLQTDNLTLSEITLDLLLRVQALEVV